MSTQIQPGSRRIQILRALHQHGPLSLKTLKLIVNPPMTDRRIQDATRRLYEKGLIIRRFDSLPRNAGHYFQNSQRSAARRTIGSLLGIHAVPLDINELFWGYGSTMETKLHKIRKLLTELEEQGE